MQRLSSLLALVAVFACAGCFLRHDTVRVVEPGVPNSVGEGAARIHPGQPVSIGSMDVCLDRPGTASIDRVTMVGLVGGGIAVDDWTLVKHPEQETDMFIGTDRRSLRSYHRPLTHTVDVVCDPSGRFDELVVQVHRTDGQNAGFHAFRIDWSSTDDHGTILVPLAIELCNGDAGAAPCSRLGVF